MIESPPATASPATWPPSLFQGDQALGLAVCVQHQGAHCWYLDRCVALFGGPVRPIGPFRPCTLHEGRHLYVRGFCVNPGRRYAYRYGRCTEDGCPVEICNRLDVLSGRTERLDAETERPHVHAPPVRVEIDEDRLAAAIVTASRTAREERRVAPPAPPVRPAAPPQPQSASDPPPASPELSGASIPTVAVWSPGPDDGPGT